MNFHDAVVIDVISKGTPRVSTSAIPRDMIDFNSDNLAHTSADHATINAEGMPLMPRGLVAGIQR